MNNDLTLLETKLYIPEWRPNLVARSRLTTYLQQGSDCKLTLISAPAGFGKTTLLSEWLDAEHSDGRSISWVSLDKNDNDPALFWSYIIKALEKAQPGIAEKALATLHSPQPQPIESVLTTLINEINKSDSNFILCLDDYHVIDAEAIHIGIIFLLDHLPSRVHVVISTRSDPPLPLARLRGRGEMKELRSAELRFEISEASAFFNQSMGLELENNQLTALEKRTEGWIAGLQLAALSIRGRKNINSFITAFAGDDRYITDYLIEEVLQTQPEHIRNFLLRTSVLSRLSGSLCNNVTGRSDSVEILDVLERSNLFIVPLDNKRHWYRYHHLFNDFLHVKLKETYPDELQNLHKEASSWYESNELISEAIHHSFAAKDYAHAANLIEQTWSAMQRSRNEATVYGWLKQLPDNIFSNRPVLCYIYAMVLLDFYKPEEAEIRLQDAERLLVRASEDSQFEIVVVDQNKFKSLPASIANAWAYRAQAVGDLVSAIKYAQQAMDLLQEDNLYERGTAAALLGIAYWASGNLEEAYRFFAEGLEQIQRAGGVFLRISGTVLLGIIKTAQGRLREAFSIYEETQQRYIADQQPVLRGTAELYIGLSELYYERGDLVAARAHFQNGIDLADEGSLPGFEYIMYLTHSRLKELEQDIDGALNQIYKAERLHYRYNLPDVKPLAAIKARLFIRQGKLHAAQNWIREFNLTKNDNLSYLREYEYITLTRYFLAQYLQNKEELYLNDAVELLERLLREAEEGKRYGSLIEILILQAIAYQLNKDIPQALISLERALELAEPEGYVQVFISEGAPMLSLLNHIATDGAIRAFIDRLMSDYNTSTTSSKPTSPATPFTKETPQLVERLTVREVEILRLIAAGMRNQEIADQLFISLHTVKRHIANAFGKLDVSNRTEAVAIANQLNLL